MKKATPFRLIAIAAIFFALMIAILVFANWAHPTDESGLWVTLYSAKWYLTSLFGLLFGVILVLWFNLPVFQVSLVIATSIISSLLFPAQPLVPFIVASLGLSIVTSIDKGECGEWFGQSFDFAKQIS